MTLREQFQGDITKIFLNENELAEWHTLDNIPCLVILDSDRLEKWKETNLPMNIALPGGALADAEVFLFLSPLDYPEPMIGEVVRYDGRPLRVQSVAVVDGMMEMVLGGNA